MCRNVYNDLTYLEVCGWNKNNKTKYLENETFFLNLKKSHCTLRAIRQKTVF